jgi:hypothetical protein
MVRRNGAVSTALADGVRPLGPGTPVDRHGRPAGGRYRRALPAGVHGVPSAVDRRIAERKLDALGVEIGAFTPDQRVSLDSYGSG